MSYDASNNNNEPKFRWHGDFKSPCHWRQRGDTQMCVTCGLTVDHGDEVPECHVNKYNRLAAGALTPWFLDLEYWAAGGVVVMLVFSVGWGLSTLGSYVAEKRAKQIDTETKVCAERWQPRETQLTATAHECTVKINGEWWPERFVAQQVKP
jgi:hypothetical protein